MRAGDRIRIAFYMFGAQTHTEDYTVEEFRHCLGIFINGTDRTAQVFTPLCELYEPAPYAEKRYLSNYGEYYTDYVQSYMNLPPTQSPTPAKSEEV